MNVILLNPPGEKLYLRDQYCSFTSKSNYYWPPLDLLIQSGIIASKHHVSVVDAIIDKLSIDECIELICKANPDLILCVTGISSYISDFVFLEAVKGKLSTFIFVTGGFLLSEYESILNMYSFADSRCLGQITLQVIDAIKKASPSTTPIYYSYIPWPEFIMSLQPGISSNYYVAGQ